jgi:type III pantothenate kinase
MFFAIDIGNTHTVLGIYEKEKLLIDRRLTSMLQQTQEDLIKQIQSSFKEADISIEKIDGIGISSVVPILTDIYTTMSRNYFQKEPLIVSASLNLGIAIRYDNPNSLGADRLCNAIAGYAKYGGPLIIIDFGTATTYDVVTSSGDYLGGVIAPGIDTSAVDLHQRTAKLPKVELHLPDKIIGTNTVGSMQAGILWGAVDAMTGMIHRIQNELKHHEEKKAIVIATGGFSKFVADHSDVIQHVEEFLVLDGIRMIYERVKRKEKL